MFESVHQLAAEIVRAPSLGLRVVPELLHARRVGGSLLSAVYGHARTQPDADALVSATERVSYRQLQARIETRREWLCSQGVRRGDTVLIVGSSGVEYVCLLLACSARGATAALSSDDWSPAFLERAIELTAPKLVLANTAAASKLQSIRLTASAARAAEAVDYAGPAYLEQLATIEVQSEPVLPAASRDLACIFTSGTTGPSKVHRVGEARALFVATLFAHLVHRLRATDRLYCCLPLHHASGLLLGLGTCLVAGVPLVLRERFSASAFFDDLRAYDASVALYIGELGRALLAVPASSRDREHRLRLLVGNGLSEVVWNELRARFGVPEIVEFYAATEFPGAIVNLTGKVGSVGHVPLARLRGYALIRVTDTGDVVRDRRGFAVRPRPDEPGELVLRSRAAVAESAPTARYVRELFRRGDAYVRSGDLFRRDRAGYYWFVDRLGDTFRFKGELVATRDVEAVFEREGVHGVSIVGVRVPGLDGKAGLAIAEQSLDRSAFVRALPALPNFARPRFLRLTERFELGQSFKLRKRQFSEQGVDPSRVEDALHWVTGEALEPLTPALWQRIVSGSLRL